ncbi:hypothetical protein R5R35_013896 [Gryllus longicercus]|uniref:Broad-complex n=1 Tax=Gryllus longicercus TaxID=2509291 RepID=A0AAN9VUQ3_9ORTH
MMADTQHFCLRWNNYQSSITSAFENLRDDEDFVDVTLACEGRSLKAHRVVLSACSPYFRELLKSTPCKHPVIVLQDVAFADLHALVEFIYHGEVNVHQRNLTSFLKTAEVLRVSGLTQQADDRDEFHNNMPNMLRGYMQHGFSDKLGEDALFASPPSPSPTTSGGATVNQLLRRAAAAALASSNRRERHNSSADHRDADQSHHPVQPSKRARTSAAAVAAAAATAAAAAQGLESNNHNSETTSASNNQVTPTDFSTSSLPKTSQQSSSSSSSRKEQEGNNMEQESSPSPTSGLLDGVKSEPVEMLCANADVENSSDSIEAAPDLGTGQHQTPQASEEQQDHDSIQGHLATSYLQPHESKLFGSSTPDCKLFGSATPESKLFGSVTSGGSFNFSMAALSADPSGLAGLANQSLQGADGTAGTSSPGFVAGKFQCEQCGKILLSPQSLRRHIENVHMHPSEAPTCNICNKVYSTQNSLRNHRSIYHRQNRNNVQSTPLNIKKIT